MVSGTTGQRLSGATTLPARLFPLVLLCGLWSAGVAAEIYKCTAADGKVQYSDTPCATDASVFTPRAAPPATENSEERMRKTQRLLNAMEAERSEKKQAAAQAKAEAAKRKRNCTLARNRHRQITTASRVFELDDEGNKVVYSDAQRAQAEARAAADVETWCNY